MIFVGLSLVSFIFILIPWGNANWHTIAGLVFITIQSQLLGYKYFRYKTPWFRWLLGLLLFLSLIIIVGSLFFYGYNLSSISLYLISLIAPLALIIPFNANKTTPALTNNSPANFKNIIVIGFLTTVYLLLFVWTVIILLNHQTVEPVQTPWLQVLPKSIFVLYFLQSAVVIAINLIAVKYRVLINSLHFFLSFGVSLFVYPLGFGFDPFIHQATEQIIAATGTLSPKPFYYIGHYSLIVWLNQVLQISLTQLDRWLVPTLAALSLPTIIFQAFKENFHNQSKAIQLLPLVFLTIPYAAFIQSTPQALSVLISLITIFTALFYINRQGISLTFIIILSVAVLAIHPLSGIPMIFFSILLGLYHRFWHRQGISKYMRVVGYGSLTALAAVILPLTFYLNSYLSRATSSSATIVSTENPTNTPAIFNTSYHAFVRLEDLIYLLGNNTRMFLLVLSAISLFFMIQKKRLHYFLHYLITFFVLIINYVLLKSFVSFDFLIPYERFIFPERILQLSFYFLWPFVFVTAYLILKRVVQLTPLLQTICWLMLASSLTISWYLSYPRFDFIEQNKGFSTSIYDLAAVSWIHDQEQNADYVVLANQSVSAAAINQYGFYRYFDRNFYYPIPTGDPLYQSYLDLVNNRQDLSAVLQNVQKLTGAKTVYLVVNNYWSGFEDIVARNKKTANDFHVIGAEKNYIFKYQLP